MNEIKQRERTFMYISEKMGLFRPVRCVLFDMDGLLLDTENLYTQGTQMVLNQFGKVKAMVRIQNLLNILNPNPREIFS